MSVYNMSGDRLLDLYGCDGSTIESAYDVNGELVFSGSEAQPGYDYDRYNIADMFTYSQSNMQSFAVYGGIIAQVKQTDAIHILDIDTHEKLREVAMDTGHGNSCAFSDEFYEEGDEFPLFYVRNAGVWVYRITGTTSELIKKYAFSADIIGTYVAGFGIDNANRRFYTASYTKGDYVSKDGLLRICEWDMDDVTDNGDGVYSMALLASNDLTWFDNYEAVQGCCYHDGYFFIACGYGSGQQYVVLVDTATITIAHQVSLTGEEIEGCGWYNNEYLIAGLGYNTIAYKAVTFADAT